jgi:hypothetical protein
MSTRGLSPTLMSLITAFVLAAIVLTAVATAAVARERIGEIGVSGPAVFVNNRPASDGMPIFSGDSVTTGQGSSAVVLFDVGGYFQLDQNTDPFFSWETLADIRCIVVKILRGQGYADGSQICISSPAADAVPHSIVNVRVTRRWSEMTLFQGRLSLVRPRRLTILPSQDVTANAETGEVRVVALSPARQRETVAWRSRFGFRGWCVGGDGFARSAAFGYCRGRFSFAHPAATSPPEIPWFPPIRPLGPGPRFPGGGGGSPSQGRR